MDPTESEQQEALAAILLTYPEGVIRGLAEMAWRKLLAGGKLYTAKASEEGVDMSLVIGTVGTIDPTSVCEDAECDQRGELMKDHRVTHMSKASKKGLRGLCPHCQGRLHNTNDASQLIAFQCLWRQQFGDKAKSTPVNAMTLSQTATAIVTGSITAWADRNLLHTAVLAAAPPKVAPPKVGTPAAGPAAAAAATPPTPLPSVTVPVVASPKGPAPAAGGSPSQPGTANSTALTTVGDPVAAEERKRKLRAALSGAKVLP